MGAQAEEIVQTCKTTTYDLIVTNSNGDLMAACQALACRAGKPVPS